jgi:fibronectin-binding autotransporter adhesin
MKPPSLLLAALLSLSAPAAFAASITWGVPSSMTADTNVVTTGTLKYAYTWNNTARTVNGVPFAVAGTIAAPLTGTNITFSGFNTINQTAFTSNTAPFTSLSTAYKGLVLGAVYANTSGTTGTMTLQGLTVGTTYQVQVWASDPRSGTTVNRSTLLTSGGNTVTLDYNVGNVGGGVGQWVIGTFTADATTESFTASTGTANQINAIQLRTAPPATNKWGGDIDANWDDTTANFSGLTFLQANTGGTVDFSDTKASGVAVTNSNITIKTGGVTGAGALFSNATVPYTLNSADATGFTGSFGLSKSGTGNLTLAGPNTFTGDTNLTNGVLNVAHASALQNSTLNFTAGATGALNFLGITAASFGGLKGTAPLHLVNSASSAITLTAGSTNQSTTYSGAIDGAGSLVKSGTGTLTLSGAVTSAGGTTVTNGSLAIAGTHSAHLTVAGGTFTALNNAVSTTATGAFTQSAGFVLLDINSTGVDSLNVTGNVSFTGGTVALNPLSAPAINTPYTLLTYSGTLTGTPVILNPTRLAYSLDVGTGTNSAITITFTGAQASLIWSGAVDTEWSNSTKTNWLNASTPDRFYSFDNVLFDDAATQNLAVVIPAPAVVAGSVTVNSSVNAYSITGSPITGPGSLVKNGTSTLTLASLNTYTGGTTITGGAVTAGVVGSLGTGPVTNNGTLNLSNPGSATVSHSGIANSLSGTGTVNCAVSTGTATITFSGNNSAFVGTINAGTGAAAGAGKILINGVLGAAATVNALANSTIYVNLTATTQPATAYLHGGDTGETLGQLRIEGATWSGPVILAGDIFPLTDATVGANSGSGTISGNISEIGGARALIKGGAGTTVLTGTNSFSGATILNAGRLHLGSNQALGSSPDVTVKSATAVQLLNGVTITGKTIKLASNGAPSTDFNGGLQATPNGTATWDGPVVLNENLANTPRIGGGLGSKLTITGAIQNGLGTNLYISGGNGGLSDIAKACTVMLTGKSTYTGGTNIIRGILQLGITDALPITTILDVDSVTNVGDLSTFDMNGFNQQVSGLQDTATALLNSLIANTSSAPSTLTINNTALFTYEGLISGNVSIIKKGSSQQTLSGTNTRTGDTTVQEGILTLTTPTLADTSRVFLNNLGTLNLTHAATDTIDKLEINGIGQAAGEYGAVGSGAAHEIATITGTGKLLVITGSVNAAFTTWINN